ncbi:MAG: conserved exported protein of unknown function [Nitrospira sp.]|nr:MAG: conserved exported protein of unknown function [Nitrospira sp.]
MKKPLTLCALATLILSLASCATYTFQSMYPSHFSSKSQNDRGQIPSSEIPHEILESLPPDFELAYYSGHLWCFRDWAGKVHLLNLMKSIQRTEWSDKFQQQMNLAQEDEQFRVFTPVGYPHVYCVVPNVDIYALFNETWFEGWLTYLTEWEDAELEIEALWESNKKLVTEIADLRKTIAETDESIKSYQARIKEKEESIKANESAIADRKAKLGMKLFSVEPKKKEPELPPFDPKIPYDRKNDPFLSVVTDHSQDVSSKPWASQQMSGGKYIDPEMAQKIDEINAAFSTPDKISDPGLKKDVKELIKRGFSGVTVTSGTRTPWRQADLYVKAKKDGTPVGKYVRSDHMFGQAADMTIPAGWGWNTSNHKFLRAVMRQFGVAMNVPKDHVHFTLANPSHSFLARRLAMVRAYHAKAGEIRQAQGAVKTNAIFEQNRITEQKAKVEKDLSDRKDELTRQSNIFVQVSARYVEVQQELQRLDAEIARREAEARRAAEAAERHRDRRGIDREPRGGWERPQPDPPPVDRTEPPQRERPRGEQPRREPPSRDTPRETVPDIGRMP